MPKVVIEIHIKKGIGSTVVANMLKDSIGMSLKNSISHPSIEKVETRVESG